MKHHSFNVSSFGFSLVEAMVALGILSIVTYSLVDIKRQVAKTSRISTINSNIRYAESKISSMMKNRESCKETFFGKDPIAGATLKLFSGPGIGDFKDEKSAQLFINSNDIMDLTASKRSIGDLEIEQDVTIDNFVTVFTDSSNRRHGRISVNLDFKFIIDKKSGNTSTRKLSFFLDVILASGGNTIEHCDDNIDIIRQRVESQICKDLGGTLINNGECDYDTVKKSIKESILAELHTELDAYSGTPVTSPMIPPRGFNGTPFDCIPPKYFSGFNNTGKASCDTP